MKTSITIKISIAFLIITILGGIMFGITYYNFNETINSINRIQNESDKRIMLDNIRFHLSKSLMDANDYIITEDKGYKKRYEESFLTLNNNIDVLRGLNLTREEGVLFKEITLLLDSMNYYANLILDKKNPKSSEDSSNLMEIMDYKFGEVAYNKIAQLYILMFNRITDEFGKINEFKETALSKIYLFSFILLIVSVVVIYLTVVRISKPLHSLRKAVDLVTSGEYKNIPEYKSFDEVTEVSELAVAFNRMVISLRKSVNNQE